MTGEYQHKAPGHDMGQRPLESFMVEPKIDYSFPVDVALAAFPTEGHMRTVLVANMVSGIDIPKATEVDQIQDLMAGRAVWSTLQYGKDSQLTSEREKFEDERVKLERVLDGVHVEYEYA